MLLHDWRYKQNKIDQFSESKNRKQNNPIEQSKIHKSSTHIPRLVAEKTDKAKKKKISSIWSWRKWISPTLNRNDPIRSHILNRVRFTNRLQLYHRLAAEKTEKVKNKWNLTKIKAELRHAHAHTKFFFPPFSWHPNSEEEERVTYFLVEKVNPSSEHLFGTPKTESIGAKSRAKTLDRRWKVEEEEAKKTVEFARAIWKFFEEMVSGREWWWLLVLELVLLWVVYKYVLVLYDTFFWLKMSKHCK